MVLGTSFNIIMQIVFQYYVINSIFCVCIKMIKKIKFHYNLFVLELTDFYLINNKRIVNCK